MDISRLDIKEADQAAALWEESGLVRAWNDPQADIVAALDCPTCTILAARVEGRVVGTVMAGYDGHRGWLYAVAVKATHRQRGAGAALVRTAEAALKARGCVKINWKPTPV